MVRNIQWYIILVSSYKIVLYKRTKPSPRHHMISYQWQSDHLTKWDHLDQKGGLEGHKGEKETPKFLFSTTPSSHLAGAGGTYWAMARQKSLVAGSKNLVWQGAEISFSREGISHLAGSKNLVWRGAEISFGGEQVSRLAGSKKFVWRVADILFGGEQKSRLAGAEISFSGEQISR